MRDAGVVERGARRAPTCRRRSSAWVTTATRRRPASTAASSASAPSPTTTSYAARRRGRRVRARSRRALRRTPRAPRRRPRRRRRSSVSTDDVRRRRRRRRLAQLGRGARARRRDRRRSSGRRAIRRRRARRAPRWARAATPRRPRRAGARRFSAIEHRAAAARDHERLGRRAHVGDRPRARARGTASSPLRRAKISSTGIAACVMIELVGVDERRARAARAHRRPTVVFPAPISPTSTRCRRSRALIARRSESRYASWLRDELGRASRRRTCAAPRTRARARPSSPRRRPRPGTAVTSVRSLNDTVSSLVSVSTVFSTGRFSVASGFIATRATSRSPVVMPPSMPPARDDSRAVLARLGVPADRVVRLAARARRRP